MRGSADYVDNVVKASNENIAGMINLDMILRPGWDDDPIQLEDLDIETAEWCFDWADTFITAAQTYAPLLDIDSDTPFTTI